METESFVMCLRCGAELHAEDEFERDAVWADPSESVLCGGNQPHEPAKVQPFDPEWRLSL